MRVAANRGVRYRNPLLGQKHISLWKTAEATQQEPSLLPSAEVLDMDSNFVEQVFPDPDIELTPGWNGLVISRQRFPTPEKLEPPSNA